METNNVIKKINETYHPDQKIIFGGIMESFSTYNTAKINMVALLKEVNDPESNYNWCIPELLKNMYDGKQTFYRAWKNLARWALCADNPELYFDEISTNDLKEGLKRIAAINIKKTAGEGSSNMAVIYKEALINKDELIEEIDYLSPELVLCCGTFGAMKEAFGITDNIKCRTGVEYFILHDSLFLDFLHPAYRGSDCMAYSHFKETLNVLIKDKLLVNCK